jgi:threonine 3-dehydrogenase
MPKNISMKKTMKGLVKDKDGPGLNYVDVPVPEIGESDVLLKVKATAICGTDMNCYLWNDWARKVYTNIPFVLGHECAAEVVEVGSQVRRIKEGDRIAVETHVPCGNCYHCLNGIQHICPSMKIIGATMDGCFAEYAVIPEISAVKIPEEISWEEGALLEPMGVALRPVSEGNVLGETVAVIGCGPIGQLAIGLAKVMGASRVFACDVNNFRLDLAKDMGADITIDSKGNDPVGIILGETNGLGVGVSIELSGSSEGINTAFGVLRKGGKIFIIGQPKAPVEMDVGRDIVVKEARVKGFHGREMYHTWELAETLLKTKKIDICKIVTHCFGMSKYEEAFELLKRGGALKVLLFPDGKE